MKTKVRIENTAWGSVRIIAPMGLDVGRGRLQFYIDETLGRSYSTCSCRRNGEIQFWPSTWTLDKLLTMLEDEVDLSMIKEEEQ